MKFKRKRKLDDGYYMLDLNGERAIAYYFYNPDDRCFGFGFNYADGGGFVPQSDIPDAVMIIPIRLVTQ